MEIRNLSDVNVEQIEGLIRELQQDNPAIRTRVFDQTKEQEDKLNQRLDDIEEKVDSLAAKIDHVFGDHFLLDGRFQSLTEGCRKKG